MSIISVGSENAEHGRTDPETSRMRARLSAVRSALYGVSIVTVLASLMPSLAFAQQLGIPAIPGHTPFVIALVNNFPYPDADVVVSRRVDAQIPDAIVIRADKATAQVLGEAVRQLAGIRSQYGNTPLVSSVYRVKLGETRPFRAKEAARWMSRLRTARRTQLSGIGMAQRVVLYLPDQGPKHRR